MPKQFVVDANNLVFSTSIPTTSTHTDENKLYTVYNILVRIQGYKHIVPKRFSEFQSFSEHLKHNFSTVRLPKFPSKGGIGGFLTRMDDSTIESRRQNLETYINAVASNFALLRSQSLYRFLDIGKAVKEAKSKMKLEEERQSRLLSEYDTSEKQELLSENNSSVKPSEQSHLNEIRGFHDDFYLRWNFQSHDLSYDSSMNNFDMKKYLYSTSPYALSTSYYRPNHASGGMLREGIKRGDLKTIKQILEEKPKLACYIDGSKQSMLHLACIFNHVDIALLLVMNGADPEYKNSREETSYDIATETLTTRIKALVTVLDTNFISTYK